MEIFWPLSYGATLALAPPQPINTVMSEIIDFVVKSNVQVLQFVPGVLDLFLDRTARLKPDLSKVCCLFFFSLSSLALTYCCNIG